MERSDSDSNKNKNGCVALACECISILSRCNTSDGGWGYLLYGEKALSANKKREVIRIINNVLKIDLERESLQVKSMPASIINQVEYVKKWIKSKVINFEYKELDGKRINSAVLNLASAGASNNSIRSNEIFTIANDLRKLESYRSFINQMKKTNSLPLTKWVSTKLSIILLSDVTKYVHYTQNLDKLSTIQSISALNMDIIRYWLVESALKTNRKAELFKKVFGIKFKNMDKLVVKNFTISSKGKFNVTYDKMPVFKLLSLPETEGIFNACYALAKNGEMYNCVVLKQFAYKTYKITLRN